ncbi:MAG TPA: hypothetical protein PLP49_10345 [Anaerohalosphaeraceae bacterium]|nr:hypothetical protein [Anaerohalosphaeraceae bacterium]HRT24362.1 hypothetical protein [Anaerohalosphaeraceae bacterium]
MANLPVIGGSVGTWGEELNNYLLVGHSASGVPNYPGLTAQIRYTTNSERISVSSQIPLDNTIPQITEGQEILTLQYTPKSANNLLYITATASGYHQNIQGIVLALFKDTGTDAIAAAAVEHRTNNIHVDKIFLEHLMTAGTSETIVFSVRIGVETGTFYMNSRWSTTGLLNGLSPAVLKIVEYWQ